jgi:hypothetical protein
MTRLLTLVAIGIAFLSTLAEVKSQRIHVTAEVVKTTVIGDPDEPKVGDQTITSVVLFDKRHAEVGHGAGVCTLVSLQPPLGPRVQCYSQPCLTIRDRSYLAASPCCPTSGPWGISAFWEAQTTFARLAAK